MEGNGIHGGESKNDFACLDHRFSCTPLQPDGSQPVAVPPLKPLKPVSQSDLARLAGVDRATVSRALSGASGVRDELRNRILTLAREHRYAESPFLRAHMCSLRRREPRSDASASIAVITPTKEVLLDRYQRRLLDMCKVEAGQRGYAVAVVDCPDTSMGGQRLCTVLQATGASGVLIISRPDRPMVPLAALSGQPAVRLGHGVNTPLMPEVMPDYGLVLELLRRRAAAEGWNCLGCILPEWIDRLCNRDLLNNWARVQAESGSSSPLWLRPVLYGSPSKVRAAVHAAAWRRTPDAVLVLDELGWECTARLGARPIALNALTLPGVEGFDLMPDRAAALGVGLLDNRLANPRAVPDDGLRVLVPVRWNSDGARA